ncbi:hypothetical protein L228DRAFT_134964 [Xylona heveae TC161]|uniref:Core domain-containing protein n=1 Tax=Xylona heveae (strain CBS 132557 / TC161) TaxID=1328760 RepID=A0A165GXY3_XYLHT|nr:hypothetical protein L228DRAFT_134964 [Xylona heveae TC161]KZF22742.1 hypothetical protein L228DRAFT_134964 [Xylona heveae TC161]
MHGLRSLFRHRGPCSLTRNTFSSPKRQSLAHAAPLAVPGKQPLLDFLAPSWRPTASYSHLAVRRRVPSLERRQCFSSSSSRRAVVVNPRKDEDGNDMIVGIKPRASHRLAEIMQSDKNPSLLLRITVESGGCHGFQYLMSLTNMSEISNEEDTVFEADDGTGAKIVMDEPSLELLKGSQVDYTMELIGSQFKIVDNPLATSSCGCGTSFDIKE